jgi:ABC-type multidrug transport system permease subunit
MAAIAVSITVPALFCAAVFVTIAMTMMAVVFGPRRRR